MSLAQIGSMLANDAELVGIIADRIAARKVRAQKKPEGPKRNVTQIVNANTKRRINNSNSVVSVGQAVPVPRTIGYNTKKTKPKTKTGPKGCTIINNREYIGDIAGNTTYGTSSYLINPGVSTTDGGLFKWLYKTAKNYEQYRFRRLRVEYVPQKSTQIDGQIASVFEYDITDKVPADKTTLLDMDGAQKSNAWLSHVNNMDIAAAFNVGGPRKFIRTTVQSPVDNKFYDCGKLIMAAIACTDTSTMGEIWVDYEVELYVPSTIDETTAAYNSCKSFRMNANFALSNGLQSSPTSYVDGAPASSCPVTNASGIFTLPAGAWKVTMSGTSYDSVAEVSYIEWGFKKNGAALTFKSAATSASVAGLGENFNISQSVLVDDGSSFTIQPYFYVTNANSSIPANELLLVFQAVP